MDFWSTHFGNLCVFILSFCFDPDVAILEQEGRAVALSPGAGASLLSKVLTKTECFLTPSNGQKTPTMMPNFKS